jgi:hypothetical protein
MRIFGCGMVAVLFSWGGSALANTQYNGPEMAGPRYDPDGYQSNGYQSNGTQLNGLQLNGVQINGYQSNGTVLANVTLNGTLLQGTLVDSPACAQHSETVAGAPLPSSCNACAGIVCNSDAHCCNSAWDATCVSEAQSLCAINAHQLVNNGTLTAQMQNDDGSTTPVSLRIDSIQQPDYYVNVPICRTVCSKYHDPGEPPECDTVCTDHFVNRPAQGPNADVYLYAIEYFATKANKWEPLCQNPDGTPFQDFDGHLNLAVPVAGAWESGTGLPGTFSDGNGNQWAGGSKIPGTDYTTFTLACRDLGALAKCLERNEYKPWKMGTAVRSSPAGATMTVSLDEAHQSCVRMLRADYCGNGVPHTQTGTIIDVRDAVSIQSYVSTSYGFEANWRADGPSCISTERYNDVDPSTGWTVQQYIQNTCPSRLASSCGDNGTLLVDPEGNALSGWVTDRSSTIPVPLPPVPL